MFGSMRNGANAYMKVGVETGVIAASPHKLIHMLFEGAETALHNAIHQMKSGDVPGKGQSISKAINIIESGLRASLDKAAGGEIALNLDSLYEYMTGRLLEANLKNDAGCIHEVLELIANLKGAWEAITPGAPAIQPARPQTAVHDSLAPRATAYVSA